MQGFSLGPAYCRLKVRFLHIFKSFGKPCRLCNLEMPTINKNRYESTLRRFSLSNKGSYMYIRCILKDTKIYLMHLLLQNTCNLNVYYYCSYC